MRTDDIPVRAATDAGQHAILTLAPRLDGGWPRGGIGRALIGAAEAWARVLGLASLTLHAGAHNARARAFYAALGFAEEEVRPTREINRWRDGGIRSG